MMLWKQNKIWNNAEWKKRIVRAGILGILPLVLCVIYCAVYGRTIGDVYVPNSYWNDELLYYKQVEGVLTSGVPGGYFGYNESRAPVLSFAVWSPVLIAPWVIWGKVFGWNTFAPFLCNLVCLMGGMFTFGYLARPTRKQLVTIVVLLSLFTPLTRFIMSCMPEIFCCALLLWYMGYLFAYRSGKAEGYLWQMIVIAGILTLMRPYFMLFLLYPVTAAGKHGKIRCMAMAGTGLVFLAGYLMISRFLSANYLIDVVETSIVRAFVDQGLGAGLEALWQTFIHCVLDLKVFLRVALQYGNFSGSMYAVYGTTGVMLLVIVAAEWKNRKKEGGFKLAFLTAMVYAAMMAAICFLYVMNDGGRHLLAFLLVGFLVIGMYSAKIVDKIVQVVVGLVLCLFFFVKPGIEYDRLPPFRQEKLAEDIEGMRELLQEKMEYTPGIGWENTVIWLSYDIVDGEVAVEPWQQLYALPGGFGINFCSLDYVLEHLDTLQSHYIVAVPGGQVEEELLKRGAGLIAENGQIVVYQYDAQASAANPIITVCPKGRTSMRFCGI